MQTGKVDKAYGMSLIEDTEKQRLADITNYDDTEIKSSISALQAGKADKTSLAAIATTGSYNDLLDKPDKSDYKVFMQETQPTQDGLWIKGAKKDFMFASYIPSSVDLLSATLPKKREFTSSVIIDGKAYIFGGTDKGYSRYATIYKFDPIAKTCIQMSVSLPDKRYGISSVAIDSKAYIFGGYDGVQISDIVEGVFTWDNFSFTGYYIKPCTSPDGQLTKISSHEISSIEKVYNGQTGAVMEAYSVFNGVATKIE